MLICINLRLTAEWRKNYYFSSFSPGTPNQSNLSNRTWSKTIKALSQKTPGCKNKKKKGKINELKCTLNWLARRTRTFTFLHRTGPRKTDRAKKFIVGKLSIRYYEHTWPIKTHQTSTRNAKRIEISLVVPGNCLIGLLFNGGGCHAPSGLAYLFPTSMSAKLSQPMLLPLYWPSSPYFMLNFTLSGSRETKWTN